MRGKVAYCFSFDENFAVGAAVALNSLRRNSTVGCDIVLLVGQVSIQVRELIGSAAQGLNVRWVAVPDHLILSTVYAPAVYYRLVIGELFPEYERIIYLDSDTVILKDIGELETIDLRGMAVGAVVDHFEPRGPKADYASYFNSGVMVIDPRQWQRREVAAQAANYLNCNVCPHYDQDALNWVLLGAVYFLDPLWNVFHFKEVGCAGLHSQDELNLWDRLEDEARILHYVTGLKPWMVEYPKGRNLSRFEAHRG